jgi:type I restriction enzyme S subunit
MTATIPSDWSVEPLVAVAERVMVGIASAATHAYRSEGVPMLRNQNIKSGRLDDSDVLFIDPSYEKAFRNKRLQSGDLITARTGYPGVTCVVPKRYQGAQSFTTLITRPNSKLVDSDYLCYFINSEQGKAFIAQSQIGGAQQNINAGALRLMPVWLPQLSEQRAIADTLSDVDDLIATLERLIAKKQAIKQGMMQQLLTGKTRLPGFTERWWEGKIDRLLTPRIERYSGDQPIEVLSCTKHRGFVRSLDYFKNQVFSRDLDGYRIIRRGDIGYPANHVEEGSIGVQELFDVALVSPIYIVMRPLAGVDTYFLQRQLKLDSYRQEFAKVTNASVNRRGSLRWPQFSQIEVRLPSEDEQRAITRVLRNSEAEIEALQHRLAKARDIKDGMTQGLLSGRTRLPAMEAAT